MVCSSLILLLNFLSLFEKWPTSFFPKQYQLFMFCAFWKGKCQFSLKAYLLTKVDFCTNLPLVQTHHSSLSVPTNLHISVSIWKMMSDIYSCRLHRKMSNSTRRAIICAFYSECFRSTGVWGVHLKIRVMQGKGAEGEKQRRYGRDGVSREEDSE